MTAFFPARAPTRDGPARSSPIRRRVVGLGVATALVAAGPGWLVGIRRLRHRLRHLRRTARTLRQSHHRRTTARQHRRSSPGGACVVNGPTGDQWLAYHAWTPGAVGDDAGGVRSLRFASLVWSSPRPVVGR
jgi:hypothetical protein